MRVELILEAIDKASAVIRQVEAAQKGAAAASKAASAATASGAAQATGKLVTMTRASAQAASAQRGLESAARSAGASMSSGMGQATGKLIAMTRASAQAASAQRGLETAARSAGASMSSGVGQATGKLTAMTRATAQAASAQRGLESAARSAGGAGAAGVEKTTTALARLRAMASAAGAAVSAGLSRAAASAASAAASIGRAGKAAGKDFARGIGDAIKAEMPGMIRQAVQSAWGRLTGRELLGGPGALRGNMQSLATRGIQQGGVAARAASAAAYSNVQGAINIDEQLRPDLGVEGARRARQAADAWLLQSPFRRDDVRAALPDAARNGALPGSKAWQALMDAAASQNVGPQQATAAWAAMRKGEYSQLGQFGVTVKTGDDGKASGLSYMANGAMQTVDVAGDIDARVQAALEARFSGSSDRKSLSMDGVVTRAINAWDSFVGKVMDAGPYDFVKGKLEDILKIVEAIGKSEGIDNLAKSIGGDIVTGLTAAYNGASKFLTGIVAIGRAVNPVVQALGGWENVIAAILALKFVGWITALLAPLALLSGGLATAATAAWGFAASLAANPITWIVAGVLALAAAAIYVYRNWETIGPKLSAIWDDLSTAAEVAWEGVKDRAEDAWNGVLETVKTAVEATKAAASEGWDEVSTAVEAAWIGVKDTAEAAWDGLAGVVTGALDRVSQAIRDWGASALKAMQEAWTPVSEWLDNRLAAIGRAWEAVKAGASKLAAKIGFGDKQGAAQDDAIERAGRAAEAIKLLDTLQAKVTEATAAMAAVDFATPLRAALEAARQSLAGASFRAEGAALAATFAVGMAAGPAPAAPIAPLSAAPPAQASPAPASVTAPPAVAPDVSALSAGVAKAQDYQRAVAAIAPAAQQAVSAANGVLASADFTSHGVRMMETLAAGIRAGAASAVAAVGSTVQQIRDRLPHSPAKVGPLSDLDKVQFGQTLAGAIERGAPRAIDAARQTAAGMAAHLTPPEARFTPAVAGAGGRGGRQGEAGDGAGVGGGSTNVNLTFNVTAGGGGADDILSKLRASAYEVAEIVKGELARRKRAEY